MRKFFYIILGLVISGCNPYQNESSITTINREIAPADLTLNEIIANEVYKLKQQHLITENLFDSNVGLYNGASVLNNELILDNSSNQNQYLDTQISVKSLNNYSLSIWFKTNDPNKIQMIFWQGQNGQNGWGAGANNINLSEFHAGLNHWNSTSAEAISVFYGYNESAIAPDSLPIGFPVYRNPATGTFDLLGQRSVIDTNYHHLVITVEKTLTTVSVKSYIDGIVLDQGVGSQIDNSMWDMNLIIGKPGVNDQRQFFGKLSKFMALNKTLTPEEVNLIYNYQK